MSAPVTAPPRRPRREPSAASAPPSTALPSVQMLDVLGGATTDPYNSIVSRPLHQSSAQMSIRAGNELSMSHTARLA
eukprot:6207260-Pleurochrysis_carterae.AAC.4